MGFLLCEKRLPGGRVPLLTGLAGEGGRRGREKGVDEGIDALYLLTKYGEPEPRTVEQVQSYLDRLWKDLECGYHTYLAFRRV